MEARKHILTITIVSALCATAFTLPVFRRNDPFTTPNRPRMQWYNRGPLPFGRSPPGHVDTTGSDDPLENQGLYMENVYLIEGDIRQRMPNFRPPVTRPRYEPASAAAGYSRGPVNPQGRAPQSTVSQPAVRNSVIFTREQTWTDRIIPYVLDTAFNNTELHVIQSALNEVMEGSGQCISFVPRTTQKDFLFLTNRYEGCWSDVGRAGGNQTVSIAPNCAIKGIVMHELLHALGFWHEHNRRDRDTYITVLIDNVQLDHRGDFHINFEANMLNISYDYYSIMHYKNTTFSVDHSKLATIEVNDPTVRLEEVGQRKYLSDKDKQRIRTLYNCPLSQCSYPAVFNDGEVTVLDTSVGSTITYTCSKPGHVLVGAAERTCLFDGSWSGSTPLCFNAPSEPSYCNFDDVSICGWSQDTTDEADWTWWCGHTASVHTGPMFDHTEQNSEGYYMYLEGTGLGTNSRARLISPVYQDSSNVCVLFWYYMYGAGMGNLTVYMKSEGILTQLIQITGNQSRGWKMDMALDLKPTNSFQIVFEASRGPRDTTDIAIDDVMIGNCDDIATYENAVMHESPSG